MAGITLAEAQAKLDGWMAAEDALQRNKSYTHADGQSLTRADLSEIRDAITFWNRQVKRLSGTGRGGVTRRVLVHR